MSTAGATQDDELVTFAAVGDVHGAMHAMVSLLAHWESRHKRHLHFVLQVGDFEPHRSEADLEGATIPAKYRKRGDFHDFVEGRARFDWPVYFIGGNHEPYGFLEQMPTGGELTPNCHYLGRVGRRAVRGLNVVGLTGIYAESGREGRPPLSAIGQTKKKRYTYFSDEDVARARAFGRADALILHEWPRGAIEPGQSSAVAGRRRAVDPAQVGNNPTRQLIDALRPKLVVAGHMHWAHRSRIGSSLFAAMGHIDTGADALGVFEARADGSIVEISR